MELSSVLLTSVFVLIAFTNETISLKGSKNVGIVDGLLKSLEDEKWDHGESACLQATTALLNGVKNQTLWATWTWNSMQLPVGTFYGSRYHFGNFDQCLQPPWTSSHSDLRMQYCLVEVKMTELRKYDAELTDPNGPAEKYIGMASLHGSLYNTLFLGVCLPIHCKPRSIDKISRHIFRLSHLPLEDVEVDPRNCQVAGQKLERATEFYVFWWIVLAMITACVLVYFMGNAYKSDSNVSKVLRCFCLTRNFDALTEISKNEIIMMHGMRALTSGILIVTHCFLTVNVALINHLDGEKIYWSSFATSASAALLNSLIAWDMTSRYGKMLLHLDTLVDTFLVMSGLLHIKGLLSSKSSNPLRVLCKRYLRLIPTYALTVLCFGYVLPHLGSGPAWPRLVRKVYEPCTKSWWRNFLMMGSKVDGKEFCMDVSWYIHCDYQLTVLGTVIFMLYHRSKRGGFLMYSLAYIIFAVISTLVSYSHELPGILWYDFRESLETETNKVYRTIYVQSFSRVSSYLVGLAMGYLMTVYRPQDYRKAISKACSILGFIIGFSLMMLVMHIGANSFYKEYSALVTAIFAALDRSVWAIGVCIIIAVCEYGTLPIINDFLSSKVFVPLSKLSYSNYLWHTLFINRNMLSVRAPMSFDIFHVITNGLGYVVISYSFSYLFWLFIEAPTVNLVNLLFDNRTSKIPQYGDVKLVEQTNGVKTEKIF